MKLTILFLFISVCTFAQKKDVKNDTIKIDLKQHQVETLIDIETKIKDLQDPKRIEAIIKALQESEKLYIDGIISTVADPKKVKYGFKDGKIVIVP